ncbi:DUF4389 domain-containing protein [Pseudarthrobacter cellobiosi]|uniref:DUF4389 domain-containing protein n=1 Tax=Pseudarthrobacter cellobiosi TaxID=2953654 RepID=UPI00208E1565|nr:DUF4389 domain-containing protein [Pseudarthrobacter sp. HLT1-5]MCO4254160.1 DUF4389 domain-containing protein [Pseudarthrobacter sp. HLT1-5]
MRARSITMLIFGTLFSMLGIGLLFGGIGASWVNSLQNDGGYLTSPSERFDVDSSAIISAGPDNMRDDAYPGPLPFDVGSIRISAESANAGKAIFVGIAPRSDVERYLSGANYSELLDVSFRPFHVEYRETQGSQQPPLPSGQDFWAASASGPGEQELDWNIETGNWSVVVMNADASPDIRADLKVGFRSELLGPIAAGLLAVGAILLVIGVPLLIFGAQGLGRHAPAAAPPGAAVQAPVAFAGPAVLPPLSSPDAEPAPYPARLWGELDPVLSRWLWLVKWFLAIPHFIVLFFLWFAFVVVTVIAGFAILFTGRFPRSLFDFNVGVLRWNWRVAFYAYSALGTDTYPPFTLARTDYPADFEVDYPERLSRGLVLVKWWLLALPHLIIIAALTGTSTVRWSDPGTPGIRYETGTGFSLLGFLVFVAAVILLFSGRYQRPLFDLLLGFNRWIYRVITYTALMRDEYPPFRLDQGAREVHERFPGAGDANTVRPPSPSDGPTARS